MSTPLNITSYFDELDRKLKQLFELSKQGLKPPAELKPRCEGYMRAGVTLGLVTNAELQQRMDAIHQAVFDMSIAQRRKQKQGRWQDTEVDYSAYEAPSFVRNQSRRD